MTGLSSIDDDAVLGYYQPFYLRASVKHGWDEVARPPSELQDNLSPDALVAYALARYTVFHEIRHFHDYFGTIAGTSLFQAHLAQISAFARFIETFRSSGRRPQPSPHFSYEGEG